MASKAMDPTTTKDIIKVLLSEGEIRVLGGKRVDWKEVYLRCGFQGKLTVV
jgi:hypothetical protein